MCESACLIIFLYAQVEESVLNIGKFNNVVKLAAFFPFRSAQTALENINAISEGKYWVGVGHECLGRLQICTLACYLVSKLNASCTTCVLRRQSYGF